MEPPPEALLMHKDGQREVILSPSCLSHHLTTEALQEFQQEKETIQQRMEALSAPRASTTIFALIPGGTTTLGYDRKQALLPSDEFIYDAKEECLIPDIHGIKHFRSDTFGDGEKYHSLLSDENIVFDDEEQEQLPPNYQAITDYMEGLLLPARTVTLRPFLLETHSLCAKDFVDWGAWRETKTF
jgi:hypothetical protein